MNKKNLYLILIMLIINPYLVLPQTKTEKKESGNTTQPLELPNFIIEGKVQLNIKSGSKQFPKKPLPLTSQELDSLNSLEKQQPLLLPPEPLPNKILDLGYKKGYIEAEFGRYAFGKFDLGYEYKLNEYSFWGNAKFDFSNEHVKNSDYNRFQLNLYSDYIAPKKYFIFGGSKTRTNLNLKTSNYKLYAFENAPERKLTNFNFGIVSDGAYSGFKFTTGASFNTIQLTDNYSDSLETNLADNKINGFLKVKNIGHLYEIGAVANLDIENFKANSTNFLELAATGVYKLKNLKLNLKAGFQTAGTSKNVTRAGLLLNASLDYEINTLMSFKADIYSGLKNNDFNELYLINPYFSNDYNIDFSYEIPSISAFIHYHPNRNFSAIFGLKLGSSQREQIFYHDSLINEKIQLDYKQVNYLKLFAESFWELSSTDKFASKLNFNYSALSENSNFTPYVPLIQFSADYYKQWMDNLFGTKFGMSYLSERYGDLENNMKINGYLDLNMQIDYFFNKDFIISLKLKNLLNSDIYVWHGYKERGIYFGINANYIF